MLTKYQATFNLSCSRTQRSDAARGDDFANVVVAFHLFSPNTAALKSFYDNLTKYKKQSLRKYFFSQIQLLTSHTRI